MKSEKGAEMFVYKLLQVMPDWHSRLVRPFKEKLNGEMSLETYTAFRHSGCGGWLL